MQGKAVKEMTPHPHSCFVLRGLDAWSSGSHLVTMRGTVLIHEFDRVNDRSSGSFVIF